MAPCRIIDRAVTRACSNLGRCVIQQSQSIRSSSQLCWLARRRSGPRTIVPPRLRRRSRPSTKRSSLRAMRYAMAIAQSSPSSRRNWHRIRWPPTSSTGSSFRDCAAIRRSACRSRTSLRAIRGATSVTDCGSTGPSHSPIVATSPASNGKPRCWSGTRTTTSSAATACCRVTAMRPVRRPTCSRATPGCCSPTPATRRAKAASR